jgi:hypothetical protein
MTTRLLIIALALAYMTTTSPADEPIYPANYEVDAVCSTDTDCGCTDDCLES